MTPPIEPDERPEIPAEIASTDGVTVRLYDLGGVGRPVVFCHATGFCGQVWQPGADRLNAAFEGEFRCIAFDFRGHGRSSLPTDGDMNWLGMGDDLGTRLGVPPSS